MFKSRFNFNFRYLKDYRIDLIDRLESHPSTIGTRRIFDSKSEKSLFPFLPLCEYRLQFVSRIFGSKHRSLGETWEHRRWNGQVRAATAPGEIVECKSGIKFSNTSVTFPISESSPIFSARLRFCTSPARVDGREWGMPTNSRIRRYEWNFAIFIPGISRRYFRRSVEKYTCTRGSIYWPRAETWKGKTWNTLNKPVQFGKILFQYLRPSPFFSRI